MTPSVNQSASPPVGATGAAAAAVGPAREPVHSLAGVGKAVVGGSAIYMLGNALARGLNFLLLPIFTRYLNPAEYGMVSVAEIVAVIVGILCGLGLNGAISRLYFEHRETVTRRNYVSTMLRFALLANAAILVLSFLVGPALLRRWVPPAELPFYPYVAIAMVTAAATQAFSYRLLLYQVDGRASRYAGLVLASLAVTAVCTLILVVGLGRGAAGLLGGKLIAGVASAAVGVLLLRNWLGGQWSWDYVRESLHLALPLLPHDFMAAGLIAADRLILARYRTVSEVGVYSVAYTLGIVMALVTNSLLQAWGPAFFNLATSGTNGRTVIGRMTGTLAVGLAAVSVCGALIARPFVGLFLDGRYAAAATVVPWIIGGYLLHGYYGLFHLAAVQARRTQLVLLASASAFVLNLALNFWWVPRIGMYGAAYATLMAYAAEALIMLICAQRSYRMGLDGKRIVGALVIFSGVLLFTQRSALAPGVTVAAGGVAMVLLWSLVRKEARVAWVTMRSALATPTV
jgi:O-antigen/teichoic acid export membrane protein